VGCNNRAGTFAPTTLVFDMTVMALLYFQADEFMESVAAPYYLNDWNNLRSLVDLVAREAEKSNDTFSWMEFEPPSPELPFKVCDINRGQSRPSLTPLNRSTVRLDVMPIT